MEWKLIDDRPIWLQLTEQLTRKILSGQYAAGERLPSVRELAEEASVNPNTMQRALSQLELDGLATSNRTAGRMVTDDAKIIDATRKKLAKKLIDDYLSAMAHLGYDRAKAAALLKEEEE
ncbi:MAG: GntR family transcriptional regulator [Oscillospiraceae bacterium]